MTYRENQMLKLELNNMYVIDEENKDLKQEIEHLKSMSYDDKIKDILEENKVLRERNGYL